MAGSLEFPRVVPPTMRDYAESPGRAAVLAALGRIGGTRTTVREVAEVSGLSISTVHHHLKALAADGWVKWTPGRAGTLRASFGFRPVGRLRS